MHYEFRGKTLEEAICKATRRAPHRKDTPVVNRATLNDCRRRVQQIGELEDRANDLVNYFENLGQDAEDELDRIANARDEAVLFGAVAVSRLKAAARALKAAARAFKTKLKIGAGVGTLFSLAVSADDLYSETENVVTYLQDIGSGFALSREISTLRNNRRALQDTLRRLHDEKQRYHANQCNVVLDSFGY